VRGSQDPLGSSPTHPALFGPFWWLTFKDAAPRREMQETRRRVNWPSKCSKRAKAGHNSATGMALPHVMPRLGPSAAPAFIGHCATSHVLNGSISSVFTDFRTSIKMFSAVSRQAIRSASRQQCRAFSSTPSVGAAAEVKKLGVIGAGQMVSMYIVYWDA
jgi:hypothetical protein